MACFQTNIIIININNIKKMYNNNSDHPRISFSHDFAESIHSCPQILKPNAPVSSDFEFSVSGNNMMTADELFFKGRLLPFKNNVSNAGSVVGQKTTLRDELLAGEDDDSGGGGVGGGGGVSSRPPKPSSSTRWKGFLGLRKSHIGSKRSDKGDGSRTGSGSGSGQDDVYVSKTPQEMIKQGGGTSNCRDMDSRMQ
uniref:uncharacterized protein LOC122590280 n=1 Tax=Erigeron canadensis TaxID=72917 RepID=UPI001CB94B02|nr:uncharacterized protein LOC122590280 [Erigeron canadensis]